MLASRRSGPNMASVDSLRGNVGLESAVERFEGCAPPGSRIPRRCGSRCNQPIDRQNHVRIRHWIHGPAARRVAAFLVAAGSLCHQPKPCHYADLLVCPPSQAWGAEKSPGLRGQFERRNPQPVYGAFSAVAAHSGEASAPDIGRLSATWATRLGSASYAGFSPSRFLTSTAAQSLFDEYPGG